MDFVINGTWTTGHSLRKTLIRSIIYTIHTKNSKWIRSINGKKWNHSSTGRKHGGIPVQPWYGQGFLTITQNSETMKKSWQIWLH